MSDAAFERGFVAGWEARGRRDEAAAVEGELRLRGQVEEAKARGALQASQQQGRVVPATEWGQIGWPR